MNPISPTRKKRAISRRDLKANINSLEIEINGLKNFMERLATAGESSITNEELLNMVESYGKAGSRLATMIRTAQSSQRTGEDPELTQAIAEFMEERKQKRGAKE